jgi:hypothetical protein
MASIDEIFGQSWYLLGQSHEKVGDINTLNDRLGPNQGSATVFKILKSPVLNRR